MYFMLFSSETFSKFPLEENEMNFALLFLEFFNIDKTSSVLPEILVTTTKVLESTVFGSRYPFTTLT